MRALRSRLRRWVCKRRGHRWGHYRPGKTGHPESTCLRCRQAVSVRLNIDLAPYAEAIRRLSESLKTVEDFSRTMREVEEVLRGGKRARD